MTKRQLFTGLFQRKIFSTTNGEVAQFDTESGLQFEPQPVSEIHYTSGTPRFLKAGISFKF